MLSINAHDTLPRHTQHDHLHSDRTYHADVHRYATEQPKGEIK